MIGEHKLRDAEVVGLSSNVDHRSEIVTEQSIEAGDGDGQTHRGAHERGA